MSAEVGRGPTLFSGEEMQDVLFNCYVECWSRPRPGLISVGRGGPVVRRFGSGPPCAIPSPSCYDHDRRHHPTRRFVPAAGAREAIFGLAGPIWGSRRIDNSIPSAAPRPKKYYKTVIGCNAAAHIALTALKRTSQQCSIHCIIMIYAVTKRSRRCDELSVYFAFTIQQTLASLI